MGCGNKKMPNFAPTIPLWAICICKIFSIFAVLSERAETYLIEVFYFSSLRNPEDFNARGKAIQTLVT